MFERTSGVPSYIEEINNMINELQNNSAFILKETIIKSGSGTNQWELNWRDNLEYLQVSAYVSGNTNALLSLSSFGLYQTINDKAPFIGWFGSRTSYHYYGGEFEIIYTNANAGIPNIKWFPILGSKPILGMKNNSENTITAVLYFLVKYK